MEEMRQNGLTDANVKMAPITTRNNAFIKTIFATGRMVSQ